MESFYTWCGNPGALEGCEECSDVLRDIRDAVRSVPPNVAAAMLEMVADERAERHDVPERPWPRRQVDDDSSLRFSMLELSRSVPIGRRIVAGKEG